MRADLDLAQEAARRAAAIVRDHFGTTTRAELKARFNPVTDADKEAEDAIVELLRRERPDDGILAEEGSGSASAGRRWIIDPLDGTVNFVHRIPHLAVSVSLFEDDEPIVAVTLDPFRDEEFTAAAEGGTRLNGDPIHVSGATDLATAVVATGFGYDHDVRADAYATTLGAVLRKVNGLRRMGSAVLDSAWVAAGRYDGYWETGLAPWDTAAGILLVREAGGRVTDEHGSPSRPEGSFVVAANPHLQETLRAIIASSL
ncbi:MAG: inositol monophosphatase family protein [Acidimicrobiia bacterium]